MELESHLNANEILGLMIKKNIIQFGNFTLKSGLKSNIYINCKLLMSYPDMLRSVAFKLSEFINDDKIMIAGVPLGGIPISTIIANNLNLPMIMIRKQIKNHGTNNIIEGKIREKNIILIEDVFTTGNSTLKTIEMIENFGLKVIQIIAIIDRGYGALKLFKNKGYKVNVLFELNINNTISKL